MTTTLTTKATALQPWGERADIRELSTRLRVMLPGGGKLDEREITALAQGAVSHGLDPLNGEIWMIPGRGLMIGVKGLRKKAREQVQGNFWINFMEMTDPDTRRRLRIPENALAYEARLFDSENIRTWCDMVEQMGKTAKVIGAPFEWVLNTLGDKPYTLGVGILLPGEQTKMQPVQCAMKRAEADALKRRFDVPFGLAVEPDIEPDTVIAGEWNVEGQREEAGADAELDGTEDEPSRNEPSAPVEKTVLKVSNETREWRKACREFCVRYPKYQAVVRGTPSGEPNMSHILGAAAKCGFAEITDGNWQVVIEAIAKRAEAGKQDE